MPTSLSTHGPQLALVLVALLGACVSFPEITDGASTGAGAGSSSSGVGLSGGGGAGGSTATSAGGSGGAGGAGGGNGPLVCDTSTTPIGCLTFEGGSNDGAGGTGGGGGASAQAELSWQADGLVLTPATPSAWWQNERGAFHGGAVAGPFLAVTHVTVEGAGDSNYEVGGILVRGENGAWWKLEVGHRAPFGGQARNGILLARTDASGDSEHLGAEGAGGESAFYFDTPDPVAELGVCASEANVVFAFRRPGEQDFTHHQMTSVPGFNPLTDTDFDTGPLGQMEFGLIAGDYQDLNDVDVTARFRSLQVDPFPAANVADCLAGLRDLADGATPSHCGFCEPE